MTSDDEVMAFVREQEADRVEKAIRANIEHVRYELARIEGRLAEGGKKIHAAHSGAFLQLAEACGRWDAIIVCTPRTPPATD